MVSQRALKERQELRKDAQAKLDASANRNRAKKARIAALEKELHVKAQMAEERNAYKEQCAALIGHLKCASSPMEQGMVGHCKEVGPHTGEIAAMHNFLVMPSGAEAAGIEM